MSLLIRGLGTAVPDCQLPQADAEQVGRILCTDRPSQAEMLNVLYRQTGIATRYIVIDRTVVDDVLHHTRHSESVFLARSDRPEGPTTGQRMAEYAQRVLPLALRAAQRALDESAIAPERLTHLVTVSCTGFAAPGYDIGLFKALGLRPTVQRTHVGFMGCHGALNGLRVARAFTAADPHACVLLVAVELCSLHYSYGWNTKRLVANALFADGAAAVVGTAGGGSGTAGGGSGTAGGTDTAGPAWICRANGSCLFPDSEDAMTWTIGDAGFEMTLSTRVPNLIGKHLRPWLESWLDTQGLSLERVRSWAVHPGGPRILTDVAESLGLPQASMDVARQVLRECGNMSSPTVLFLLQRLRTSGAELPCVALGFGPGLVVEAALFA